MAIKIPANISPLRRKLAEAAARRKVGAPPVPKVPVASKPADNGAARKAGQETAEARKKAREAMQSAAEKDLRVKELEEQLASAIKRAEEAEPLAEKWTKHDHVRLSRMRAKFPPEEQKRIAKLDADALELLAEARGFTDGATQANGQSKTAGVTFKTAKELSALAETNPDVYNKALDDVKSGKLKFDMAGNVV